MRSIALAILLFISTAASAFQPRIGLWGNAAESGSGYMMDIQNGLVALTVYSYLSSGPAQWYLASGPLVNNGHNFVATLDKYVGGQCISCIYRAPSLAGNDGTIAITFLSETLASVSLPGGRTTVIQPFDFGYGPLPAGLLGEWIFVYDILAGGTTFAERFDFTTTLAPTATGSGIAADPVRLAGCELQVSGSLAGQVICADGDSAGNLQNGYAFRYGLDETYGGVWIAPGSGNQYAMKGFRVVSKVGPRASATSPPDSRVHAFKAQMVAADGAMPAGTPLAPEFVELWSAIRAGLATQQ